MEDKNVSNCSFCGHDSGIEEFKKIWGVENPDSPIWNCLSKVLSLGGVLETPNSIVFPYVFFVDYPDDIDDWAPSSIMVVTGTNVNVREQPNRTSKIIGQLSYDIVIIDYEKTYPEQLGKYPFTEANVRMYTDKEWYYVTSTDKKICGYVYGEYVWSNIGLRIGFDKKGEDWKIAWWANGD